MLLVLRVCSYSTFWFVWNWGLPHTRIMEVQGFFCFFSSLIPTTNMEPSWPPSYQCGPVIIWVLSMFGLHHGYENALHSWVMEDMLSLLLFPKQRVLLFSKLSSVFVSFFVLFPTSFSFIRPPTFLQLSDSPLSMFNSLSFLLICLLKKISLLLFSDCFSLHWSFASYIPVVLKSFTIIALDSLVG